MANVDGGSLSFTSELDNSQLDAAIDETLRRVQGLSDGIVDVGDTMDATTRAIVDSIDQSRQNISELEDTVSSLDAQISAMQPGDAQTALMEQAQAAKAELENERKGLVGIVSALNNLQSANETAAASGEQIRTMLAQIGVVCNQEEANLESLEAQFSQLGVEMNKALTDGQTEVAKAIQSRKNAIEGEIRVRRKLLTELRNQSDALEEQAEKLEQHRKKTEDNANAQVTLRQRIKDVKEQMADLIANGVSEQSAAYKELVNELGRLQDIQGDIATQGKIMANDENQFAGLTSGLQGVVGGFTAASSAMALFAGENENLQAAMLKVQQLMSIIMGLQQVSQTLNKDSAFQLVTLNGLREWWNKLLAEGAAAQAEDNSAVEDAIDTMEESTEALEDNVEAIVEESAAEKANAASKKATATATNVATNAERANTVATTGQTVAATAGTTANIGLAGAFRMVGAAIKSIPVFGWIIAGISALIGLYSHFSSKAAEAKKAQEEFSKSMVENCYKPIGIVNELSGKWAELGDNLEAKKKFIEENKDAFNQLGVAVNGVTDAENILNSNKEAFINAQIEKAKAMTYVQMAMQKQKEYLEAIETRNQYNPNNVKLGLSGWYSEWEEENQKAEDALKKRDELFALARESEKANIAELEDAGIIAIDKYDEGTLGAIEKAIANKQAALKKLTNNDAYKESLKEIEELQKQADAITGKTTTTTRTTQTVKKDPFLEQLNKRKNEYARFIKWINSGDEVLIKSARQEFSGLLKEGATYIDYLRKQRDTILSIDVAKRTKEQNKQLRQLNDAIAEETKQTVLEAFNKELSEQLTNAESVMEMLNIIEKRRKELEQQINDQKDDADKPKKPDESATDYTNLQEAYQTYQDSLVAIQRDYNERRRLAMLNGEESLLEELTQKEQVAITELQKQFLGLTVDWSKIMGGFDTDAVDALEKIKATINDALTINPDIDMSQIEAVNDLIRKLSGDIQDNDPFTVLGAAYNSLVKEIRTNKLLDGDDEFVRNLKAKRDEYARFKRVIESGDETLIAGINEMFPNLMNEGKTYLEYLYNQKQRLSEQVQMGVDIGDSLTVIDAFIKQCESGKSQSELMRESLQATFGDLSATLTSMNQSFDGITQRLNEMGITMDEETESVITNLTTIVNQANRTMQSIDANTLTMDNVQNIVSLIERINNARFAPVVDYNGLSKAFQDYQKRLTDLQKEYADKRHVALLNGEQSTLDALSREEEKRLVELQRKFLNLNVDWTQIFGGIDDAALSVLERLNGKINEALSINPNINGEGVDNLRQSLTALSTEIQDNDPFTVLGMAYNALAKQLQLNSLLESDDAFVEQLRAKKAEYEQFTKVIESGDATLIAGVNQMFPGLMESGKTYLDYLIGQKQKLSEQVSLGIDVGNSIEIIDAFIQQMQTGKTQSELMRDALKGTFDDVSTTLYAINQSFGNISSDLKEMGISMDEQTESVLNNLSLIVNQANQALSGIDANSLSLDNVSNLVDMLGKIQSVQFAATAEMNDVQKQMWEALQSAQRDAEKQTQAQVKSLLEEYGSYVAKKRKLEEEFNRDITLLTQARINATTDAERAELDAAIANRRRKFEKDNESSGDEDYDELKKTYKNYQQQITYIQKEYAEKRRIATEHNDQMLLAQLAQEEQEKLSEVQKNLLENSVDWQKLFGNLDELSTSTIKELIQKIEQQKIQFSASFSPDDLKAINEQLEKARQEIESRNPFTALSSAYSRLRKQLKENKLLDDNDPFIQQLRAKEKEYEQYKKTIETGDETLISGINQMFPGLMDDGRTFLEYLNNLKKQLEGRIDVDVNAQSSIEKIDALINQLESGKNSADALREALKDTFSSVAGTIDLVKGTFDSVVSGMDKMGVKFDEETQAILNDIGGIMDGASQLATGIASGNPLSIIQGSIGLLSSAFDLFNSRDRKAEQSIKRHQRNIEELQNAYTQLEWATNKALGGEVYKNQQAAIRNMKQQQSELYGMIRDENSKKHTDASKISEYQEQIAALGRQIEDMYAEIAKDILQTDAKSFADSLGDALVDAFSKGENAAQAFNKTVNEILKNAVVNQLKKRFLEQQLQSALDQLQNQMGYWRGDDFIFDGLSESEIEAFRAKVQSAANNYNQALEMYKDLFKDLNLDNEDESSLSGAVKGVSEETAGIISGQMNAIRINQIEATNILRQQLQSLNTIAQNTAFNRNLVKIDRIISLLERAYESDSLRSQGLGV